MLSYLEMDANAEILHDHPHEQGGIVLEANSTHDWRRNSNPVTGSMFFIPANIPHRATALDPAIVLDAGPIREDYAQLMRDNTPTA